MNIKISDEIMLEPLSIRDAGVLYSVIDENRTFLEQSLYWVGKVKDKETAKNYIMKRINSGEPGASWFKIKQKHAIVGIFGVKSTCYQLLEAEIGYWLTEAARGNGIISKAIIAVGKILKDQGLSSIKIMCLDENKASIAVAERAGANHINSVPNYMEINGKLQNLNIYRVKL
ncbi:GNAT family N-acetyltransferase [Microbulbifer sp. TYP-18]|uniref:GNAT family N-acetyltransferase n=1 Tax=Microbulbifer sp. TYP-18 TaxID=3230024 RepID=UPI0034C64190